VRIFFGQEGRRFFKCKRPHFLARKTSDFSKFMVYPLGQEERGSIFRDFVRTSFMDGLLYYCFDQKIISNKENTII